MRAAERGSGFLLRKARDFYEGRVRKGDIGAAAGLAIIAGVSLHAGSKESSRGKASIETVAGVAAVFFGTLELLQIGKGVVRKIRNVK